MAGLPWIAVHRDLPRHRKALALGVALEDLRGWTYLVEGWLWAAENAPEGVIRGEAAAMVLEAACGWRGEPGRFAAAAIKVGFVDPVGEGLAFHDWEEHEGAHIAAAKASAKRAKAWRETKKVKGKRADKTRSERTRTEPAPNASKMGERDRDQDPPSGEEEQMPPPPETEFAPSAEPEPPAPPPFEEVRIPRPPQAAQEPLTDERATRAVEALQELDAARLERFGGASRVQRFTSVHAEQVLGLLDLHAGEMAWLLDTYTRWATRSDWPATRSVPGMVELFLKPEQGEDHIGPKPRAQATTAPPSWPSAEPAAANVWASVLECLGAEGKHYALTWLQRAEPKAFDGNTLRLGVPDRHFGAFVEEQYRELLADTLEHLCGQPVDIELEAPDGEAEPAPFPRAHSFTRERRAAA
jgi:hypothetical protein